MGSQRDAPTPTRFTFNDFESGVPDSSSQSRLHDSTGVDPSFDQEGLMYRCVCLHDPSPPNTLLTPAAP